MVRRHPGQDTQGQPDDPAQPNDSLPLQSSGEGEIALFTIPGSARDAKVRDVRHAERLRFPDLDLTASADLQALAAALTKGESIGGDLPLQAPPVPSPAPAPASAGGLDLAADDPGLEWFDDEGELEEQGMPAACPAEARPQRRRERRWVPKVPSVPWARGVHEVRRVVGMLRACLAEARLQTQRERRRVRKVAAGGAAVFRKGHARLQAFRASAASQGQRLLAQARGRGRRSWASATEASARLAASVRHGASTVPLDEVMRGALFTAAMVAIVVVLARFDWARPGEWPAAIVGQPGISDTSLQARSAPGTPPRALAGQPIAAFGRLAPSVTGEDASVAGIRETPTPAPVETLAADVRRDRNIEGDGGAPVAAAASRVEAPPPAEPSMRAPVTSVAAIDFTPPTSIVDAPPLPPASDAVAAGGSAADTADAVLASAIVPADEEAIVATLSQLEVAYERRDANLARVVWPTVDARALARAFDGLKSQSVEFDGCRVTIAGATGEVECLGTTTYVPRVGSQYARTESREWVFRLEKGDDRWVITRAAAR